MRSLTLAALVALAGTATAQCTPDPLYADSVFGVWPDTLTDFMPGTEGVFYSDTLNLIVPNNATDINPNLPAAVIDSVQLTTVTGLPPGLSVSCNSQTPAACTYLPQQLGCGLIEGTPTTAGTYPMEIVVQGWTNILGFPVPQTLTFPGYSITIAPVTGIAETVELLSGVRNVPNPFAQRTSFEFTLSRQASGTLRVYNLVGEELHVQPFQGRTGANRIAFDGGLLSDGIYLYKITAGGETRTGRMVVYR